MCDQIFRGFTCDFSPASIKTDRLSGEARQPVDERLLGEDDRRFGFFQNVLEPFLRISRIDRHIRSTGLQDANNAHQHLQRALDEKRHQHIRPHPHSPQTMRELVRATVEFAIGQRLLLEHHGHLIGSSPGLLFDQVVQTHILLGIHRGRVVPFHQQLMALRLGQQRQRHDPSIWIGDDAFEQHPEMTQQALNHLPVKQVRAVLDRRGKTLWPFSHLHRQIEFGGAG